MKYVLFVCNHNAGRSQMAQAFFERMAPPDLVAESAGSEPAQRIWPEVMEALREVGIDISNRRPKRLMPEMQLHADWAVTFKCGDACPYVPAPVEDWDVPDPAGRPLEEVRAIRDDIETRVREFLATRIADIRSDQSSHQFRLAKLLPRLIAEFEGAKTAQEIRDCSDAILMEFAEVPVRSFMMTIAERKARECLRKDVCDAVL
jgi:protein-tyrosine-phosphatase